jgi:uncharacterized protein YodC (DUF2158 family)
MKSKKDNVSPFKPGDVVVYKSGGPFMIVMMVREWIHCDWFDTTGVFRSGAFHPSLLSVVPPLPISHSKSRL